MQAEVPILRGLGFEVYVPKVFTPATHHRSSAVSYDYDESLTIPAHVLEVLNRTDFYTAGLDDEVVDYINEYFDVTFFIVLESLHINAMRYFRGPLVMRIFGVVKPQTYYEQLGLWGRGGVELLDAVRDRFWFGACYPTLAAIEPPLLAEHDVYLPIALPSSFIERHAGTWRGGQAQILFVCPDINIDAAIRKTYEDFKRVYGDLPHVIVGRQSTPVDDPHVRGFVSDEEFIELAQTSAVMVYTSHEPRMMQYPPVEAAVIGLPVVFYRESLLGALLETPPAGAVGDDREGRRLVERLIAGEPSLSESIASDQQRIATVFSEGWAESVWAKHLLSSGLMSAIEAPNSGDNLRDLDTNDSVRFVAPGLLIAPEEPLDATPLTEGVAFRHVNLSTAFAGTHGLGHAEHWGRWVHGDRAVFRLAEPVSGLLEVEIRGGTVPENFGDRIAVDLGAARGHVAFDTWIAPGRSKRVALRVDDATDLLTLTAPVVFDDAGYRLISFGISTLRIRPLPSAVFRASRTAVDAGERGLRRIARAIRLRRMVNLIRSVGGRA